MAWILSKDRRKIYIRKITGFWEEFRRKKIGIFGLVLLALFVFTAIFSPWLTPYNPMQKTRVAQIFARPEWITIFPQFADLPTTQRLTPSWNVDESSPFIKGWGKTVGIEYKAETMENVELELTYEFPHSTLAPNEFFIGFTWKATKVQDVEYSLKLMISTPEEKSYRLWSQPNSQEAGGAETHIESVNPFLIMSLGYAPGTDNVGNIIFSQNGDYTFSLIVLFRPLGKNAAATLEFRDADVFLAGHVHGILGTDYVGSDVFSDLVYGTRISLMIGLLAAIIGTSIGLLVGVVSGYLGGIVDEINMRIVDILICLPLLPLLLALVAIYGKSIFYIVLFIGIFGWQGLARVIRSQALSIRETAYIESARASGASGFYIMIKHILPNVLPVAFASMVLAVPGAILFEAALSFLGFGDPRVPTWGKMLQYSFSFGGFVRMAWWWILPPGFAIIALCLAFVFVGHAFDDVVNPRLRRRR